MCIRDSSEGEPPACGANDYRRDIALYAERFIVPEDRERALREMEYADIVPRLERQDVYQVLFDTRDASGARCRKSIKYSYIDRQNQILLMTRQDITDAVAAEKRAKDEIAAALKRAELASLAKGCLLYTSRRQLPLPPIDRHQGRSRRDPAQAEDSLRFDGIPAYVGAE